MKILKLTFNNLASFEGEHTIDFESGALGEAALFSITGPTGSGKSTILDAISLALYGKAPRFEGSNRINYLSDDGKPNKDQVLHADDPRNILRNGTKACYAQLLFVANDNKRYVSRWSCTFKRTNFSKIERELYELAENDSQTQKSLSATEIDAKVQELVGLEYDEFSKTIMLAQNSFANFIKENDTNKAILLEKLTGTEIYTTVAQKIVDFHKEAKERKEALENQTNAIALQLLDDEELAEKNAQKQAIAQHEAELQQKTTLLTAQLGWWTQKEGMFQTIERIKQEYQQANEAAQQLAPQRSELSLYDKSAPILPDIRQKNSLDQAIVKDRQTLAALVAQLETLHTQQSQLNTHHNEAVASANEAKAQSESSKPIIKQARELASAIREKEGIWHTAQQTQRTQEEDLKRIESKIADDDLLARTLQSDIERLQTLQQQVAPHSEMIAQRLGIIESLRQLHHNAKAISDAETAIQAEEKKRKELSAQIERDKKEVDALSDDIGRRQKSVDDLAKELGKTDSEQLGLQREAIVMKEREIASAINTNKRITELFDSINVLEQQIAAILAKVQSLKTEREGLLNEQQQIEAVLPELEQAYQLTVSNNVDSLRSALVEGDACPVCGATHHPYAHDFEKIMEPLKQKIDQKRSRKDVIAKLLNGSAGEKGLEAHIRTLDIDHASKKTQLEHQRTELNDKINELGLFLHAYPAIPSATIHEEYAAIAPLLNEERNKALTEYQKLDDALKQIANQQSKQQKQQTDLNQLKEKFDILTANLHQISTQLSGVEQRHADLQLQKQTAITDFNRRNEELSARITLPDWQTSFTSDFNGLIEEITRLGDEYDSRSKKIADAEIALTKVKADKANGEVNKKLAQLKVSEGAGHIATLQKEFDELRAQYVALTKGEDPDELEKRLENVVTLRQKKCDELKEQLNQLSGTISHITGSRDLLNETLQANQKQGQKFAENISEFIAQFNTSHPESLSEEKLQALCLLETDWSQIRETIRKADETFNTIRGKLAETEKRSEELESHPAKPTLSKEELQAEQATAESQRKQLDEEKIDVISRLKSHESALKAIAGQKKEIDIANKLYNNWKTLYDLLGNATGTKFRETAQSYTLQYLIRYANEHLKMLNRRYSLVHVTNTLGLKIIDHDRADEVRNITSLSGGETFLISLSLALALSSISTHNVQIGNLFIDEGFGTLDSDNLNIVIDALSNLQSMQGKKVGVISHTNEMKERISTQIRVYRTGFNGRSEIEIVD